VRWEQSFCYFSVLQASDKVAKVSDKHCEQASLSQDEAAQLAKHRVFAGSE
jgi:hypothetical protein